MVSLKIDVERQPSQSAIKFVLVALRPDVGELDDIEEDLCARILSLNGTLLCSIKRLFMSEEVKITVEVETDRDCNLAWIETRVKRFLYGYFEAASM